MRPKRADRTVADEALGIAIRYREVFGAVAEPKPLDETGLRPLELQLLLAIYRQPAATLEQLSTRLRTTRPTLSHALMTLRESELVDDKDHSNDGRRRERSVTKRGTELIERFCRGYEKTHRA